MRRIKTLKSGYVSEETIHKNVIAWVKENHPDIQHLILHFPNEGKRTPWYGKLLKSMGMRAGVSDLFIAISRHNHHGAWIELKSSEGIVTQSQRDFLEDMKQQGFYTNICWSEEEAINAINWYCYQLD